MILAAHHVGMTVSSLDRAKDFYMGLLGFQEVFTWNPRGEYIGTLVGYPHVDLHSAVLRLPGTDVCLELLEYRNVSREAVPRGNANPGTAHLAFFVEDLMAEYRRLVGAGVQAISEPVTPTMGPNKGGKVVYLIDPDGFRLELIQSAGSFTDYAAP
jgi:catechol 2,3-dioxygenase-like lactoylglutathione lyase family enzyme